MKYFIKTKNYIISEDGTIKYIKNKNTNKKQILTKKDIKTYPFLKVSILSNLNFFKPSKL